MHSKAVPFNPCTVNPVAQARLLRMPLQACQIPAPAIDCLAAKSLPRIRLNGNFFCGTHGGHKLTGRMHDTQFLS